jgi:excinuclease ABC subunit A
LSTDSILIRGAREHNLKNLTVELPREKLIVFTGLSGSGKSSLAFDTIYAEGQRRYVESLSAYARQFLGQMDKPDVDFIDGLSPAISIDQKTASRNPRSTVGTVTEVHDYLRLLYARIGIAHCPNDGTVVERQTPQQIVDRILELEEGTRFQVLARWCGGGKGSTRRLLSDLAKQGFARARIDGEVRDLTEEIRLDRYYQHTIEVIVDRLVSKEGMEQRLTQSLETALSLAEGVADIEIVDGSTLTFSQHLACSKCGLSFEDLQPRNFSFNSPYGACPECSGIGTRYQVDPELVIADPDLSLGEGAIAMWSSNRMRYYHRLLGGLSKELGFSMDTPWKDLSDDIKRRSSTAPATRSSPSSTPTGSGDGGAGTPPSKGPSPSSTAAMREPSPTRPGSTTRSTWPRCPATPAAGAGSTRSRWRSPSKAATSPRCPTSAWARPTSSSRAWS